MDRIPPEVLEIILSNTSFDIPAVGNTASFWTQERCKGYEDLRSLHDAHGTLSLLLRVRLS